MSKGHARRPSAVSATDFATNWDRTFGPQTDSAQNVAEGQSKGQCASVHSAKSMPGKGIEPL